MFTLQVILFSVQGPLIVLVVVMRNMIMLIQLVLAGTCEDEDSIAEKASVRRTKKRKHGINIISSC